MPVTVRACVKNEAFAAIFTFHKIVVAHIHEDARMTKAVAAAVTFYPFCYYRNGFNSGQGISVFTRAHNRLFITLRSCGAS